MHDSLIAYMVKQLNRSLTESETDLIRKAFIPKKLRKHQFLLQEGEICKSAGFIVKGAMKQYLLDASGKEDVLNIYIENWWVGDRESFVNETPTPYYIDTIEDTEILIVNKENFERYMSGDNFMTEVRKTLIERQALHLLKRVHITKTYTAEQRLADLEKSYPEFLKRFPQHIIASYLGMTKETLSRIRANMAKK